MDRISPALVVVGMLFAVMPATTAHLVLFGGHRYNTIVGHAGSLHISGAIV